MGKTVSMDKMKKNPHSTATKPSEPVTVAAEQKEKKKAGRKKVKFGDYETINISVPVATLEKMKVAKLKYGNNLTAYVNAVIEADLEANFEKYCQIQEYLNS